MAEMAVSLVIDQLLPLLGKEAKLFRGIHEEFAGIKDELECIQAFLKDADKRSATTDGVKTWVKQVREAAFRIEDIIDDYLIQVEQQPRGHGCVSLLHKLKTMISRRRIASEILDIKSYVRRVKERSKTYGFQRSLEQGPSNSREIRNSKWHDPRLAALYMEESEVVGFEEPRKRLIDWMVKGRDERTVVSVVGMGGQGKTTLAKKVFDSKDVVRHFDCRVWITVSQSYNVEELLREMLIGVCREKGNKAPTDISQMNQGSLTEKVRNDLKKKRYIFVFDDVWNEHFWDDIEFAVNDNKKGSRIFITTRNQNVVGSCIRRSCVIEMLELKPLTQEQSMKLFNKKAFKVDCDGCCPKELTGIANEIVQKCNGLPLAIVAIGGLLSTGEKTASEWHRFRQNLSLELKQDTNLIGIKEILGLSYDDLPYYLKSCLLYFAIYPEDYVVSSKRLIRQWIAEGFVKEEEIAEGYLTELIHRSLVQVSSLRYDGKVKCCRVHNLIHDMILEKTKDLNFFMNISDDGQSNLSGIVRRLLVTTKLRKSPADLDLHIERSHVRSLFVFEKDAYFWRIPANIKLLKLVDYPCVNIFHLPLEVRSFIHLKYLSLNHDGCIQLPKSIGMLQNLETLEATRYSILKLPKEISKLRKLRHLIGTMISLAELKNGIGEMTSLLTLRNVGLKLDGSAEVIKELGKLKQIRDLGLLFVQEKDGISLSSSINEMEHLKKLKVQLCLPDDISIGLDLTSAPMMLQKISLRGKLKKLPNLISKLQNLVVLRLMKSCLTEDPMQSLKSLPQLLILSLTYNAYEGLGMQFEDGGFQTLKELYVEDLDKLRDIIIEKGALPSLKKLQLLFLNLKNLPKGILHLDKLDVLNIQHKYKLEDLNWIKEHMPTVKINY